MATYWVGNGETFTTSPAKFENIRSKIQGVGGCEDVSFLSDDDLETALEKWLATKPNTPAEFILHRFSEHMAGVLEQQKQKQEKTPTHPPQNCGLCHNRGWVETWCPRIVWAYIRGSEDPAKPIENPLHAAVRCPCVESMPCECTPVRDCRRCELRKRVPVEYNHRTHFPIQARGVIFREDLNNWLGQRGVKWKGLTRLDTPGGSPIFFKWKEPPASKPEPELDEAPF